MNKLKELILLVALESQMDEKFGMVKLNKILFFIDFKNFRDTGRSVTGAEYQKLPLGPAPRALKPVLDEMKEQNEATVQSVNYFSYSQERVIALRAPDDTQFTPAERQLVEEVIAEFRPYNASEISELSHGFLGWQIAELGDTIPYESVYMQIRDRRRRKLRTGWSLPGGLGLLVKDNGEPYASSFGALHRKYGAPFLRIIEGLIWGASEKPPLDEKSTATVGDKFLCQR